MKVVIIIGPPGSGKGTQIAELTKDHQYEAISGGDISRALAKKSTKFQKIIADGGYLDDETIMTETEAAIAAVPGGTGIIFDGIPRTLRQAEKLGEVLEHQGRTLDGVVYIELEEDKIIERLSHRKICSICGKNVPEQSEKCVECGGRPVLRSDDQPATIIKRIQTFLERTLPLVNYYQNMGILTEIDGDQKVVDVARDIKEKLLGVEHR